VDITLAAAQAADCVIAQVNPQMPVQRARGMNVFYKYLNTLPLRRKGV